MSDDEKYKPTGSMETLVSRYLRSSFVIFVTGGALSTKAVELLGSLFNPKGGSLKDKTSFLVSVMKAMEYTGFDPIKMLEHLTTLWLEKEELRNKWPSK